MSELTAYILGSLVVQAIVGVFAAVIATRVHATEIRWIKDRLKQLHKSIQRAHDRLDNIANHRRQ